MSIDVTRAISVGAGICLAAILLYFSLQGIEWRQVWTLVVGAKLGYLVAGFGLATIDLWLRALRWRILLRAEGPVGIGTAFWATSAGYFGNNFLPARAGELVRTFMISSRSR